ncbi:MAG: MarR family transcriptional regulator [Gordonia sp. (in: high G+C Gram-positive bacteria)]|uniref:MarR family winged helix-turn-helix transcriptional regulator n=1 Tax=Gordonia sp. (in: high G+C Gram-positive bacteria) TaxID=84139 RepID=UPI003BB57681
MSEAQHRDPRIAVADLALRVARRLEARKFADPLIAPLTPLERLVIHYVDGHPGTSLGELAEHLTLQTSNASAAVRRLVDLGLVERTHDQRDGRRLLLSPTRKAHATLARVHAEWGRAMAGADLAADDVATAVRVLAALDNWLTPD